MRHTAIVVGAILAICTTGCKVQVVNQTEDLAAEGIPDFEETISSSSSEGHLTYDSENTYQAHIDSAQNSPILDSLESSSSVSSSSVSSSSVSSSSVSSSSVSSSSVSSSSVRITNEQEYKGCSLNKDVADSLGYELFKFSNTTVQEVYNPVVRQLGHEFYNMPISSYEQAWSSLQAQVDTMILESVSAYGIVKDLNWTEYIDINNPLNRIYLDPSNSHFLYFTVSSGFTIDEGHLWMKQGEVSIGVNGVMDFSEIYHPCLYYQLVERTYDDRVDWSYTLTDGKVSRDRKGGHKIVNFYTGIKFR